MSLKSKDATPLLAKRLREMPQWFIEIPVNVPDRDGAIRRATREPDWVTQPPKQYYFSLLQKQLIALFIVAVLFFLLAFEIGLIEPIYKFFVG